VSLFRLVRRNLMRHPIRSFLTFGFAVLALFLLVFLRSAVTTLDAALKSAAKNRVVVQSATSLFVYMPYSYRGKIEGIPGVESTGPWNWIGGYYQDERNRFAQFAVDMKTVIAQYPEIVVREGSVGDLMADREGVLIGTDLAAQFGWKLGDRVPIIQTIYAGAQGEAWAFNVRAIYESTNPAFDDKTMFLHWEYFEEKHKALRDAGYGATDQDVGIWMTKVREGFSPEGVITAVDAMFEAGPQRTSTQTEAAFQAQFASMLGNLPTFLGWIGTAILVAIFFSVLNTNGMAARERARDVGVLKALGFRDRLASGMLLLESMLLIGGGGLLGVALAWLSVPVFRRLFGILFPNYHIEPFTVVLGLATAVGIGFLGGLIPALRLARLRTVDVLREGA